MCVMARVFILLQSCIRILEATFLLITKWLLNYVPILAVTEVIDKVYYYISNPNDDRSNF